MVGIVCPCPVVSGSQLENLNAGEESAGVRFIYVSGIDAGACWEPQFLPHEPPVWAVYEGLLGLPRVVTGSRAGISGVRNRGKSLFLTPASEVMRSHLSSGASVSEGVAVFGK